MEQQDNNRIEDFVRGFFNEQEQQAFEQKMETDEDLRAEVDFHKDVASVIRKRSVLKNINAQLEAEDFFAQQAEQETTKQEAKVVNLSQRRSRSIRRYLAYAASLLVLVTASLGIVNTNYSNQALVSYSSEEMSLNTRRGEGVDDPFKEGVDAFNGKEYEEAIAFFERIPPEDKNYQNALLKLAKAQYEAEQYSAAAATTEKLLATEVGNAGDRFDAEWLFVQSKLANDELDAIFEERLEAIATDDNHDRQLDAQQLQQQLNSFWRKLVF